MPDELDDYLGQFKKKSAPKAAGDESVARVLDDEFSKLGYSDTARLSILGDVGRENNWNRKIIFGGHSDPKNKAFNRGIISWQGDRRTKLDDYLKKQGLLGRGDDDELRGMARFMDEELKTDFSDVHDRLKKAQKTYDASEALRQYIKYVPDGQYNSFDKDFRVKNNADWAKRAKRLGLGMSGLDSYLDGIAKPQGDGLDVYLDNIQNAGNAAPGESKPIMIPGQQYPNDSDQTAIDGTAQPVNIPATQPTTQANNADVQARFDEWVTTNDKPKVQASVDEFNKLLTDEFNAEKNANDTFNQITELGQIGEAIKDGVSYADRKKQQDEIQKRFNGWKTANPTGTPEQFNKMLEDEHVATLDASKQEWLKKNPVFAKFAKEKNLDPFAKETADAYNKKTSGDKRPKNCKGAISRQADEVRSRRAIRISKDGQTRLTCDNGQAGRYCFNLFTRRKP